ncbi:cytochrome P450 [Yinghuangia sp. ASG 101]|uniref:cytochrome P450 n=1 Tax=Yinghuangia sp. ASG 101 TaxID=2896848 RepID=UPI001E4ABBB4|nr:cytochrome P450 [Yinghuangia sp. ASG 101]UGQ12224.1 cytochrome P450 [Yinghuangia sp. ASG 101]
MSSAGDIRWDPYNYSFADDPYPTYARLREEVPLYYNEEHDFYAVSRYTDCQKGLGDWETYSSARGGILELIKSGFVAPPGTLIFEDPPVHDIHRKLLARVFTPRRVATLEPQVRAFCARALDTVADEDRFDLVQALSIDMPMRVIGMLLGIPESDQEAIRDSGNERLRTEKGGKMEISGDDFGFEAFREYITWRKDNPSDDLMTELMNAEFEDENGVRRTLTDDEILVYCTVVAGAGNETTGRLIGWIGAVLARHPEQRRILVEEPALIPGAIEEILRFEPTGPFIARYVTKDTEVHGQTVPEGSAMMFLVAAANRDPRRFDNPDRFDVRRVNQTLTFGVGAHYCLGAALARLEGRVAMEEILRRWPEWDVDWDNTKLAQTSTVRGWETLPLIVR